LQVHDALVEQGIDPASDSYYAAIEQQVAAAFPDKWAQHLAILAVLGEARYCRQHQSNVWGMHAWEALLAAWQCSWNILELVSYFTTTVHAAQAMQHEFR
jgi:hypothetical protein